METVLTLLAIVAGVAVVIKAGINSANGDTSVQMDSSTHESDDLLSDIGYASLPGNIHHNED